MLCDVRNVTLYALSSTTVLWTGYYVELDVPPEDCVLALQPRTDTLVPKHTKPTSIWPEPQILEAVGVKVRLVNSSQEPKLIGRHEHLSQILPTGDVISFLHPDSPQSATACNGGVRTDKSKQYKSS